MSKIPSPYCIQTESGKLELTKGAYLTLLKRKASTMKTTKKSKPISHIGNKQTKKKKMTQSYGRCCLRSGQSQIVMGSSNKTPHVFTVHQDNKLFESRIAMPLIQMYDDNDNESQWIEIDHSVKQMAMSLNIAAFDRRFMHDFP